MVTWRLFSLGAMFFLVGLLDAKIRLDPEGDFCQTKLHRYARSLNGFKAMRDLLVADYDPDQEDTLGNTALMEACDAGILINVICLVEHGADYKRIDLGKIKNKRIADFFLLLIKSIEQQHAFYDAVAIATERVISIAVDKDDEGGEIRFFERPPTPKAASAKASTLVSKY